MSALHHGRDFAEIGTGDVPLVGGKNASLGEMHRGLAAAGVRPSDHPAFAARLVRLGIDSLSLDPDTVLQVTRTVLEAEGKEPS